MAMLNKPVALKATEQPVDTSTAAGKAFFDMLGALLRKSCGIPLVG
jgi:DNA invertase Pin-like site-specific DNA recombinase